MSLSCSHLLLPHTTLHHRCSGLRIASLLCTPSLPRPPPPPRPRPMATLDGHAMPPSARTDSLPSDRFSAALANVTELGQSLDSLQHMLGKALYVDEEVFANASVLSKQTRTLKAQERRIRALERELDAAIAAAGHARAEKKQAEAGQRAAEARTEEVLRELEDTTVVFKLHAEELRAKQDEVEKKKDEIQVLKAIIETLRQDKSGKRLS
ncbi:hypothetical protein KC19_3G264700 [Ceratodon purpureus]|uniref:Uncharacterized protein n=1 Tax=Ceratodon purpureus TaxID=3225 RepID=A0A8T0IQV3_CERPU|nr:hypothetical protein KC19_3G264700 [Ceratodon purpureus]